MKKKYTLNGSNLKKPNDKRSNFIEVPAMVKPIPVPKVKAETSVKPDVKQ